MKNIFAFIILLVPIITFAQDDLRTKDSLALFGPTPVGKPDGEKVSMEIGTNGGHLISSDGKAELIIPAGALAAPKMISIQPITNCNGDNIGEGYRLEPSGNYFQQPVLVVFHYTDNEFDRNSQQQMGIAFQDEKGSWFGLRNITLDTISKTITGNTKHFCDCGLRWRFKLMSEKDRVKVTKEVHVFIHLTPPEDLQPGETMENLSHFYGQKTWSVNGIPDGDAKNGTLKHDPLSTPLYKAPANVPDNNPVEIMIQIEDVDFGYGASTLTDRCKIWVYDDQYEVKMAAINHNALIGYGSLKADLVDSGSFIVSMEGKRTRVVDIKNNLYKFTNHSGLNIEYLNETSCTGPINITGVRELRTTWADPPKQPYSIVEIQFMPAKIVLPEFKVNGKVAALPPLAANMMAMLPAWPMFIKFDAKEGEQTIFKNNDTGTEILITVKQLKE